MTPDQERGLRHKAKALKRAKSDAVGLVLGQADVIKGLRAKCARLEAALEDILAIDWQKIALAGDGYAMQMHDIARAALSTQKDTSDDGR